MITNIKRVIKCAGGKTQLLGKLAELMPSEEITAYCKPFIGGEAMLFSIQL